MHTVTETFRDLIESYSYRVSVPPNSLQRDPTTNDGYQYCYDDYDEDDGDDYASCCRCVACPQSY